MNTAQKLILAQPATLTTTVDARAQYQPPGSLAVTKTIDGPAAGTQGDIVINVVCDGEVLQPPFVIPAGTPRRVDARSPTDRSPRARSAR